MLNLWKIKESIKVIILVFPAYKSFNIINSHEKELFSLSENTLLMSSVKISFSCPHSEKCRYPSFFSISDYYIDCLSWCLSNKGKLVYLTLNVISSSNKYLLSAYCVLGSVTESGNSTESKTEIGLWNSLSSRNLPSTCRLSIRCSAKLGRLTMLALLGADIQLGENKY